MANLSTPAGLLIALVGRARLRRGPGGLILAEGFRGRWLTACAFTVGDVIVIPDRTLEEVQNDVPDVLVHEEQHSWQYTYCGGLFFLPLYLAACGWSLLCAGNPWARNFFEVQAGLRAGGYLHDADDGVGYD